MATNTAVSVNVKQPTQGSDFQRSNGLLRFSTVLMGAIAIGLTASKFRATEFNEVIYLATLIFCGSISFIHFFGTFFLVGFSHGGPCFKIADFIFHMTGGILLLVSSVLMLLIATSRGKVLDYRFQDANQVMVRTIAGIFGLQNSFLYFTLSYLTITNKYLVYCQRNPRPKKIKEDGCGAKEVAGTTTETDDSDEASANSLDPEMVEEDLLKTRASMRFFLDRFTWRRLLVDEILEARVATVLLGALNMGLIADSYQVGYETEEFFFSMVVVCFCLTFLSQISYASGAIRISESASTLIDTVIQFFSCVNLLAGGVLMLGSVIQNNTYGYQSQDKSIERTSAAVLGIINGCLYCYIGANVKRSYFSRLRKDVVYVATEIESGLRDDVQPQIRSKTPLGLHVPATIDTISIVEDAKRCVAVS